MNGKLNMAGTEQAEKSKSMRIIWTPEKEAVLVDLWSESIDDLRGVRKNAHVFQEMAQKLQAVDSSISWTDVRTKVDNLTRKYRQEKQKIGPSGGETSSWVLYPKINEFLGSFAINNAQERSMQSTRENIIEIDPEDMVAQEETPTPAKRRKCQQEEVVALMRERNEMQKEHNAYVRQTLDDFKERSIAFQNRVLEILENNNN